MVACGVYCFFLFVPGLVQWRLFSSRAVCTVIVDVGKDVPESGSVHQFLLSLPKGLAINWALLRRLFRSLSLQLANKTLYFK